MFLANTATVKDTPLEVIRTEDTQAMIINTGVATADTTTPSGNVHKSESTPRGGVNRCMANL